MKNVHIDASRSYDVRIGRGLLDDCGRQIAERVRCASAAGRFPMRLSLVELPRRGGLRALKCLINQRVCRPR